MFLHVFDSLRSFLPDRPWHASYAPPLLVAAVDHGATWVTLAGLTIGFGGLSCHVLQTAIRVREHLESRPGPPSPKAGS